MSKEKTFEHPPRGHAAILAYDPVNDRFRVLEIESDQDPNLKVVLTKGGQQPQVGNIGGDDIGTGTIVLFVGAMLYGFDGTNWDRLRCDEQQLNVNLHGYDGNQWRKSPLIRGYTDRISVWELWQPGTASPVEHILLTVPAGWVYTIQAIHFRNRRGSLGLCYVYVWCSDGSAVLHTVESLLQWEFTYWGGSVVLKEDDRVRIYISGQGDSDIIEYAVWGYGMRVDM